ncbi:MAG TPA: pyridoxamine 5'-phosphate oxidase family protein [Anaerolineales bacterium]|nr:pyridoxamine 5'-phosphate oxidase family protein [Anaerolineales bacterium]
MANATRSDRKALIEAVLAEPVLARLATTNPKTMQPHVVPVWFMWDGSNVWVSSFVSTRKIRELKHNPQGAVLIESKQEGSKLTAVLLEGAVELVSEPRDLVSEIANRIYVRYLGLEGINDPEPQSWLKDPENLLIKLTPSRIISW